MTFNENQACPQDLTKDTGLMDLCQIYQEFKSDFVILPSYHIHGFQDHLEMNP